MNTQAVKQKKVLRDNIQGLRDPVIKRAAHRAGVKSVSGGCYEEVRGLSKVFLDNVLRTALISTYNRRAKTVNEQDIQRGLELAQENVVAKAPHVAKGCGKRRSKKASKKASKKSSIMHEFVMNH